MKKQNNNKNEFTIENIYDKFAIFFFSTLFFILFIFLVSLTNQNQYTGYGSIVSFTLFFLGYGYLSGEFISNYLVRTFNFIKKRYERYKHAYWILFSIVLIILLILIGVYALGKEKTIEISITTGLFGALTLLSYFIKQWYEKSKKNKYRLY